MASERTIARLQAQIQRRIAHCLQFELADPRASFVTVTRVERNSDLSIAKVFYSVLGSEADRSKSAAMLEHAKGFIRRQLGSVLRTKSIPDLRFQYDDAAESADRIEDLIEQARDKDRELRGDDDPPRDASTGGADA